jgi:hypothetical protein
MLATIALAASVANYMVHQNLTIPANASMSLYQSDNTTPISNGQDITTLWSWTGTQFTITIIIHNVGNIILTTGLNTTQVPSNWTITILGNGSLSIGAQQTVTLTATPPNLVGGTSTGDFDLWFTG